MSYTTHADLGGRVGFGAVAPESDEAPFHAAWEARALAVTLAMGATGEWNLDQSRSARETLPDYARLSYYEIWIAALERLLIERGLVGADELAAAQALHPPRPVARILHAADVRAALAKGSPTERAAAAAARFRIGDRIRTCATAAAHHTRLPGYARGRVGIIERVHGVHVFADAHAQGLGEAPQWLYGVAFDARELWGTSAAPGPKVAFDAWESYLEPA
ncbi:MAG: nitrile hydratase subunit beta [Burkholderiaceae bacterium]|nr:nitrile hydratase subunit beta [Burkholderiaceae bacterium]